MTVVNLHTITIAGIYLFFAFLDYDLGGPEHHGKPICTTVALEMKGAASSVCLRRLQPRFAVP